MTYYFFTVGVLALWALCCNDRTFKQREWLLVKGFAVGRASYRAHFWALFFLRDPLKLYEDKS